MPYQSTNRPSKQLSGCSLRTSTTSSNEHLQHLQQNGFVVFQLLQGQNLQAAQQHLQDLEDRKIGKSNEVQHRIAELLTADNSSPLIAQLICHPAVLEVVKGFLGAKCRCATFSSNTLLPQDGRHGSGLGWHPDYPYHDIDQPWPPPEFPLGCQVKFCII